MNSDVAAIVLAAGRGSRFGAARFKLLEELAGKPVVRHVVDAALASRARSVFVVTGHESQRVETALRGAGAALVHNADYAEGLASSLRAGLARVEGAAGGLVMLADMPLVAPAALDRLIAAFEETGACAVVPTRNGRRGNPVLLGRASFARLRELQGDKGARDLLRAFDGVVEVEIDDDGVLADIDLPDDLALLRSLMRN
jgi:molybdenum cofactor cytidylyltransferase